MKDIPVTIDLGKIALSAEQVASLRQGATLSFEAPLLFDTTLRIGGYPWAKGSLSIENKKVFITILDVPAVAEVFALARQEKK